MKWKNLTSKQMRDVAVFLEEQVDERYHERIEIKDCYGYDFLSALKAVFQHLNVEAEKRSNSEKV